MAKTAKKKAPGTGDLFDHAATGSARRAKARDQGGNGGVIDLAIAGHGSDLTTGQGISKRDMPPQDGIGSGQCTSPAPFC